MLYEDRENIACQIRVYEQLLRNTDYKAIKHADGVLSDEEYEETKTKRQNWRIKINEYQEQLAEIDKQIAEHPEEAYGYVVGEEDMDPAMQEQSMEGDMAEGDMAEGDAAEETATEEAPAE